MNVFMDCSKYLKSCRYVVYIVHRSQRLEHIHFAISYFYNILLKKKDFIYVFQR